MRPNLRPTDEPEALALLRQILERLVAIEARLAVRKPEISAADAELVRRIAEAVGARTFSGWEVVDHARLPGAADLRAAVVAAIGSENSQRLGKRLQRVEGQDVGGLRVVRVGVDRDGVLWRIARE